MVLDERDSSTIEKKDCYCGKQIQERGNKNGWSL